MPIVTVGESAFRRAIGEHAGVRIGHDVVTREVAPRTLEVRPVTLLGALFLSVLSLGA